MLVPQAAVEQAVLVSNDEALVPYGVPLVPYGVPLFWWAP
jgi:hypothetical protein